MSKGKINTYINARGQLWNVLREPGWSGYTFERDVRIGRFHLDFYCAELRYGVDIVRELDPDYTTAQHRELMMARGIHVTFLREQEIVRDFGRWLAHIRSMVSHFELLRAEDEGEDEDVWVGFCPTTGLDLHIDEVTARMTIHEATRSALEQCLSSVSKHRFVANVSIDHVELDFLCLEAGLAVEICEAEEAEEAEAEESWLRDRLARDSIHIVFVERSEAIRDPHDVAVSLAQMAELRANQRPLHNRAPA